MDTALSHGNCAGLAANQIGYSQRIILTPIHAHNVFAINPVIAEHSQECVVAEEGCLSVDGIVGRVRRFKHIMLEYMDEFGHIQRKKLSNLEARVAQHEIDHLDGVLFIEKLEPRGQAMLSLGDTFVPISVTMRSGKPVVKPINRGGAS